jgi:hypothetical protein
VGLFEGHGDEGGREEEVVDDEGARGVFEGEGVGRGGVGDDGRDREGARGYF